MKAWYYKTRYTKRPIELIIYADTPERGKQLAASVDTYARVEEIFLYRIKDYDADTEEKVIKIKK